MINKFVIVLISMFLTTAVNAADYRYSVPLPKPAPVKHLDATVPYINVAALHLAQTNPDPWKTQAQSVQQNSPAVQGQPVVVTAPAIDTTPGLLSWVLTAIAGTGTGGILLNLFRKPKAASIDPSNLIQNPDFHNVLEQVLGKLLNSNEVRGLARTGLGFVPGVGGFATQIEEVANRAAKAALAAKVGVQPEQINIPGATAPVDSLEAWKADLLSQVGNIVQSRIEAALAKKAAGS